MTASETHGAIVLRTPEAISRYRLLVLRAGIKLELKGMRHSRGRWYMTKIAQKELGYAELLMKPTEVLAALESHIASLDP